MNYLQRKALRCISAMEGLLFDVYLHPCTLATCAIVLVLMVIYFSNK
jgi:hypothetical protein